jgi:hypothetical protein
MGATLPDLDTCERRLARRLSRLFRIERTGGFDRRPAATIRRLIERRGALIDELIALERRRRSGAAAGSAALHRSMAELAGEVRRSRDRAEAHSARLQAELGLRRGRGPATGLRGGTSGTLIGRG